VAGDIPSGHGAGPARKFRRARGSPRGWLYNHRQPNAIALTAIKAQARGNSRNRISHRGPRRPPDRKGVPPPGPAAELSWLEP